MRGVQKNARWFIKLHRRMIKPPYPVIISCPACGHKFIEVNSDLIEISNDHGMGMSELKSKDAWSRIKHSCGAKITLYWKD